MKKLNIPPFGTAIRKAFSPGIFLFILTMVLWKVVFPTPKEAKKEPDTKLQINVLSDYSVISCRNEGLRWTGIAMKCDAYMNDCIHYESNRTLPVGSLQNFYPPDGWVTPQYFPQ